MSDSIQCAPASLEPETLGQAIELCVRLAQSGIIPEALRGKPHDVLVLLLTGRDLGLSVAASMRAVYVVKGRPCLAAAYKVARAQQHPACEYFRLAESTAERATWEAKRRGTPSPTRITWTIQQAQRAGLAGRGTWAQYPDAMLRWRAASALVDAVFPDAAFGLATKEELDDLPQDSALPRDVTPPPLATAAPPTVAEPEDAEFTAGEPPQPAPTPEVLVAEPAAPEPEASVVTAVAWIEQAFTREDLAYVAGRLAQQPEAVKRDPAVRAAYSSKRAELAAAKVTGG